MKLTLNGSPEELSKILSLISDIKPEDLNGKTIKGNFAQVTNPVLERNEIPTPLLAGTSGPECLPGPEPGAKKVRRTKEQMEKDAAKMPAAPTAPAAPVVQTAEIDTGGVTMEEMTDFVLEKSEAHGPAMRTKLTEFGVRKVGELPKEKWNAFWIFLQAL